MSDNSSIDSDMSNTEKELALMLSTFLQEGKQHSIKQHVVIDDDTATNNSSTLSTSFSSLAIQRQSKDIPDVHLCIHENMFVSLCNTFFFHILLEKGIESSF